MANPRGSGQVEESTPSESLGMSDKRLDDDLSAVENVLRGIPQPSVPNSLLDDLLADLNARSDGSRAHSVSSRKDRMRRSILLGGIAASLIAFFAILSSFRLPKSSLPIPADAHALPATYFVSDETDPCNILPPLPIN